MTITEAAEALRIDRTTVHRRLQAGIMVGTRVHPRLWLIPKSEVERWRQRGRLKPGRKPRPPQDRE